jgi:type II secretory pathway pseudopilin PulG
MRHSPDHQQNQGGFTLVEAMLLAAILAIFISTFAMYSAQRVRQMKTLNEKNQNRMVTTAIKTAASQAEAITATEEFTFPGTGTITAPAPGQTAIVIAPPPPPAATPFLYCCPTNNTKLQLSECSDVSKCPSGTPQVPGCSATELQCEQ